MESTHTREPSWNKGKLIGQKPPLEPKDIWAIRIELQNAHQVRGLDMFNLAIDSKLFRRAVTHSLYGYARLKMPAWPFRSETTLQKPRSLFPHYECLAQMSWPLWDRRSLGHSSPVMFRNPRGNTGERGISGE